MRRLLATGLLLTVCFAVPVGAADKDKKADKNEKDTEKAAATRKALEETKISVNFKDDRVQDVADEISKKLKDAGIEVRVELESKVSGVTRNAKITFSAKDKTAKEVLEEFCKACGYGYIVVSGNYSGGKRPPAYPAAKWDGAVLITKGEERGYPDPDKK